MFEAPSYNNIRDILIHMQLLSYLYIHHWCEYCQTSKNAKNCACITNIKHVCKYATASTTITTNTYQNNITFTDQSTERKGRGIKSILHMYYCGARKSHPRTRIIRQKRGSAEFLTKLFRSEGGISLSHNNTS